MSPRKMLKSWRNLVKARATDELAKVGKAAIAFNRPAIRFKRRPISSKLIQHKSFAPSTNSLLPKNDRRTDVNTCGKGYEDRERRQCYEESCRSDRIENSLEAEVALILVSNYQIHVGILPAFLP